MSVPVSLAAVLGFGWRAAQASLLDGDLVMMGFGAGDVARDAVRRRF